MDAFDVFTLFRHSIHNAHTGRKKYAVTCNGYNKSELREIDSRQLQFICPHDTVRLFEIDNKTNLSNAYFYLHTTRVLHYLVLYFTSKQ